MMRSRLPLALTAFALAASTSSVAAAQPVLHRASDGITVPGQPLASTDTAAATAVNPANLAFLPGPEARFTWIHTAEASPDPTRGYAADFAAPLWLLASGLRVDWMIPTLSAAPPYANNNLGHRYNWIRWGNAIRAGDYLAFGTTLAWSASTNRNLDGYFSVTSGVTARPSAYISGSVVARDWNTPTNELGNTIEPSFDMGLQLRPVGGHRWFEVGLEASYRSQDEAWVPSANLGVDVPYLGRLRSGVRMVAFDDPEVVASVGLDINLDRVQVSGGAMFGNRLTGDGTGFYAGAALRTFTEKPKVPGPARVVRLRLESTPGVRRHTALLRALWRMADDPEVDGLLLVLRKSPATSMAHAEEIVDALRLMRRRGKKVLCHLEDASGRELFVCSAADRVAINPAGGVRFAGLATRNLYFGGLLRKLGVKADFVRIGLHKSAPEMFLDGSTAVARKNRRKLLKGFEKVVLDQIGRGRKLSDDAVKKAIAKGPFIATEARQAKLVDQLVYEDELKRFTREAFGRDVKIQDYKRPNEAPKHWRAPAKVAVVYLHGNMVDGRSRRIPLLGVKLAGSYTVAKALRRARQDPSVRAVVFRIETGGGSSLASDVILREASLTAKAKPLIVSMGSAAASGGYYASVAGKEIFASKSTVTGSIGIFYGKVDVSGLLGKLGVQSEAMRTAPRADAESLFRPFTDKERKELGVKVKQFYDLFIGRVSEGRKMTPAQVHAVAQGRVWLGGDAKRHGLVDHVGGLRQALARARELGQLPPDSPIVQLPKQQTTIFEQALKLIGVPSLKAPTVGWVPPPITDMARAFAPFLVVEPHKPLAQMEMVFFDP